MTEDDFIISTFTWSYSKLAAYYHCGHEFYRRYIECEKSEGSFFTEYGSYIHKIIEMYCKGEISIFDISQYYEEHFDENIKFEAPPNKFVDLRQSYFEKGMDYINNINIDFDKYEVLGVEKEIHFTIAGEEFVGFIDLLLRDKKSGEIITVDHKSASIKFLKDGSPSKKDIEHVQEFKRQQYMYSKAIKEEYGVFPSFLRWNFFKDQFVYSILFNEDEYNEAIKWAEDTVNLIKNECLWLPDNSNSFYCNFLCGYRNAACDYKQ